MKNYQVQNKFGQCFPQIKVETALSEQKQGSESGKGEFRFFRGEKDKRVKRRPESIIQKLKMYSPVSFEHVSNFLGIITINQRAIRDKTYQESYFRSMFYIRSVEKVQVRKNALILHLKNSASQQCQSGKNKIQYLIERYRSFGDLQFYQLASQLQICYQKYRETNFKSDIRSSYEGQPLSRFIQSMQDKVYSCKVAPNKMIISRGLLQLLGQDMQSFALELCKYKTPMQEIISAEQYCQVINKSIQSFGLLCDFMRKTIDLETLQEQSYFEFYDYLCTRKENRIYCQMKLYMPTPLMHCFEAIEVKQQSEQKSTSTHTDRQQRKLIAKEVQEIRLRQAESLKQLIKVQENMLLGNRDKVAGYAELDGPQNEFNQ